MASTTMDLDALAMNSMGTDFRVKKHVQKSGSKFSELSNKETILLENHSTPDSAEPDNHNSSDTPGPGAYRPEACNKARSDFSTAPAYTMTARHDYSAQNCTPGPGAYSLGRFHDKNQAPHYSFGIRHSFRRAPFLIQHKK